MTERCVWAELVGQTRASAFLEAAVRGGAVSHAYLFVGPAGAGKKTAARALACALVCEDGGCGGCRACTRVKHGSHPDVRVLSPQGAGGYLKEQVDEVIHDVGLKPVEGSHKVYTLDAAETLNDAAANAFLKTLEEPPDDVVIVLLARDYDAVIPTIASRCQVVRFAPIPPSAAIGLLVERTGATPGEASGALAAAGGVVPRALEVLRSSARREAREEVLRTLHRLRDMDGYDVLSAARTLLESVRAPLDELKAAHAEELAEREAFLGRTGGSRKPIEDRHKRELSAREREGVLELLDTAESWLRDCLTMVVGAGEIVANVDDADELSSLAAVLTPQAAVRAIGAVEEARRRLTYNVSPQLAVEAMLFSIQEVFRCPR